LDSTVHESAHHGMQTAPVAELVTRDLGFLTILNDSTDIWCKAMDNTNGLECFGGKAASLLPGYAAGSVHLSRKMARGLLLGMGINWSKRGKAELALRGMGTSADGTTAALTPSAVAALPAVPVPDFGWKPSAITINNQTITTIESLNITVDPKPQFEYLADLPEPTDVTLAGVN